MSKSPIPKRHHFVPIMHQLNFANHDGMLFCFDRTLPDKGIQPRRPGNLFVEGHYYSQTGPNGEKDATLEIKLGEFEGFIKPIMDKLIAAGRTGAFSAITPSDIDLWLDYFYLQGKRTPDAMRDNLRNFDPEGHLDKTFARAKARFPSRAAEIEQLDQPAERKRLIRNAEVQSVSRGSRAVAQLLRTRGIAISRIIARGKSLVLGSHPMVRMTANDLRDLATELWLPVAPDVAVGLGHANGKIAEIDIWDSAAVRRMNVAIAGQSRVFASPSRELVRSLARHFGHSVE